MGKLHPEIEKSMGPLRRLNQLGINVPLLALRKYEQGLLPPEEKRPPVAAMEDILIPGEYGEIPLRIITPIGEGPFPVFVFFHGGGFCSGSYGEILARSIAGICRFVVVSVNYRLAPENKFPIPLSDCYTAAKWASENVGRIGGMGTSLVIGGRQRRCQSIHCNRYAEQGKKGFYPCKNGADVSHDGLFGETE